MTSKPHQEHLAAFREWAHSPYGKPKSEWTITREQAYELFEQYKASQDALYILLDRYTMLVRSGDCGFWDPEVEPAVIAARAALSNPASAPVGHAPFDPATGTYSVGEEASGAEESPWRWTDAEGRRWKAVPDSSPASRQGSA